VNSWVPRQTALRTIALYDVHPNLSIGESSTNTTLMQELTSDHPLTLYILQSGVGGKGLWVATMCLGHSLSRWSAQDLRESALQREYTYHAICTLQLLCMPFTTKEVLTQAMVSLPLTFPNIEYLQINCSDPKINFDMVRMSLLRKFVLIKPFGNRDSLNSRHSCLNFR
jgi:hypothetical protein